MSIKRSRYANRLPLFFEIFFLISRNVVFHGGSHPYGTAQLMNFMTLSRFACILILYTGGVKLSDFENR